MPKHNYHYQEIGVNFLLKNIYILSDMCLAICIKPFNFLHKKIYIFFGAVSDHLYYVNLLIFYFKDVSGHLQSCTNLNLFICVSIARSKCEKKSSPLNMSVIFKECFLGLLQSNGDICTWYEFNPLVFCFQFFMFSKMRFKIIIQNASFRGKVRGPTLEFKGVHLT